MRYKFRTSVRDFKSKSELTTDAPCACDRRAQRRPLNPLEAMTERNRVFWGAKP